MDTAAKTRAASIMAAMTKEAHIRADLTAAYLQALGARLQRTEPLALPKSFLFELGYVLRLISWQRAGIHDQLLAELPPPLTLLEQLWQNLLHNPRAFCTAGETSLPVRVIQAWFRHAAITGQIEVQADVVVHGVPDEVAVEAIVDFLWRHRHLGRKELQL